MKLSKREKEILLDAIYGRLCKTESENKVAELRELQTRLQVSLDLELDTTNTCDKCQAVEPSDELIWITAEDFQARDGEIIPSDVYEKDGFDALCEPCYQSILI